jgi:low affinity Fe/Cu permease
MNTERPQWITRAWISPNDDPATTLAPNHKRGVMENSPAQKRISRLLHWVGEITSRAGAAALVAFIMLLFIIVLSIEGFPGNWEVGFATVSSSITLVMLFVIQHTQSRQQIALQLKLDELIRSSPHADDFLVKIEKSEDDELINREQDSVAHHESLREPSTED